MDSKNNIIESTGVIRSNAVNESNGVSWSCGVNWSGGVNCSDGVNCSEGVNWSDGVNGSEGVNWSDGVYGSFGILNSDGVANALFLANKAKAYSIFGVDVSKKRFDTEKDKLEALLGDWQPTFNNIKALYLANGSDWVKTPIRDAKELSKREAWKSMPKAAIEYVKSWPEYNAEMFTEITGIEG